MDDTQGQMPSQEGTPVLPGVEPDAPAVLDATQLAVDLKARDLQISELIKSQEASNKILSGLQEADQKRQSQADQRQQDKQNKNIADGNWKEVSDNQRKQIEELTAKNLEQATQMNQSQSITSELDSYKTALQDTVTTALAALTPEQLLVIKTLRSWDDNDITRQMDAINDFHKLSGGKKQAMPGVTGIPNRTSSTQTYDNLVQEAMKGNGMIMQGMYKADPIKAMLSEKYKDYSVPLN